MLPLLLSLLASAQPTTFPEVDLDGDGSMDDDADDSINVDNNVDVVTLRLAPPL